VYILFVEWSAMKMHLFLSMCSVRGARFKLETVLPSSILVSMCPISCLRFRWRRSFPHLFSSMCSISSQAWPGHHLFLSICSISVQAGAGHHRGRAADGPVRNEDGDCLPLIHSPIYSRPCVFYFRSAMKMEIFIP